jgi:putative membrane-bound dehydrogenase-like protein
MAFDDKGRLWIAEAHNYPVRAPDGKGRDRIIILADPNGDGHFESRKVFTEGLNLVSGFELGFGGVWVGAAPHLLFIPDRNQDDKPDGPPEVLLDGWGYQDTHETLNSFIWGPDGWLYGCQGVFVQSKIGKPGTPENQRAALTAGVWRYHPLRHEFEVFAHGGSNQWGLDFNQEGDLFMTHCRSFYGGGGTTHVIRNAIYWNQANRNYGPLISPKAPSFAPALKNFMLASARYDSGEGGAGLPGTTAVYGGHSHVGTMIYLADNWPAIYHNHLFTHNLHGHQINHQRNVRSGSGYQTFHAGSDMLFSPDPSYLPVDLRTGPDGAVYSIDWSDTQHCHNPSTEVWDRSNGRVYRMQWAATYQPRSVNLGPLDDRALVDLHTHANEWFVRTARRLLQERSSQRPLDAAARGQLSRCSPTRKTPWCPGCARYGRSMPPAPFPTRS